MLDRNLVSSNRFGNLVSIISALLLQFGDFSDVFFFGFVRGDSGVDLFLPGLLLGFALREDVRVACLNWGEEQIKQTFKSNIPGVSALEISSPIATLYKPIHRTNISLESTTVLLLHLLYIHPIDLHIPKHPPRYLAPKVGGDCIAQE